MFLGDRGTVAGHLRDKETVSAPFIWRGGRLTRLKGVVRVAGLNNRDQVAVDTPSGPGIWEAGKGLRLWLGPRSEDQTASVPRALGIDDTGNLAVVRSPLGSAGGNYRVLTWPKATQIAETYPPVAFSPDGAILAGARGDGRLSSTRSDARLYEERSLRVIGEEGFRINPLAVARGGWVCGELYAPEESRPRPFIWRNGLFVRPLWGQEGKAVSVNERGEAVGIADGIPMLWAGGSGRDLKKTLATNAGYRLVEPLAINAKGQILVLAEPPERPFPRTLLLLTPKPQPR